MIHVAKFNYGINYDIRKRKMSMVITNFGPLIISEKKINKKIIENYWMNRLNLLTV